jgi:hypothetical protein
MKNLKLLSILLFLLSNGSSAQTVGLFLNMPKAFNGYTLFGGAVGDSVYLIDNCGKLIHKWHLPSVSVRQPVLLCADGSLLAAGSSNNPLFTPGDGIIEKLDWNSNVTWTFVISDSFQHSHHDFKVMPNGNILVAAWERKTSHQVENAGRNPANIGSSFWPDKIMELKPIGTDSAAVVWEWRVWDHLIQDFDPSKDGYGVVSQHTELIDVNMLPLASGSWNHINSIDYNPALDQILLSARNFNEIWIIDHSTTKLEARGHSGGNCGKGGDLLYRWGNAAAYQRGVAVNQRLYAQHDAQWIKPGYPHEGMISIFNNGAGRPAGAYSTVEMINPPLLLNNNYHISGNAAFGPSSAFWIYPNVPDTSFFTNTMGGATMQPNGNFLVTEANTGEFFEVDSTGTLVWRYVCPVKTGGIITQGDPAAANAVFKINRYDPSYSGLVGQLLTPDAPIELNPLPYNCSIFTTAITEGPTTIENKADIYPNPASGNASLSFSSKTHNVWSQRIADLAGRTLQTSRLEVHEGTNYYSINTEHFASGTYLVELFNAGAKIQILFVVQ